MAKDVELSSLDLRYEDYRMKNAALEERLLASIAQRGIEEPLEGVQLQDASSLLKGFKRYHCARKLQLRSVPYASLGDDEVAESRRTAVELGPRWMAHIFKPEEKRNWRLWPTTTSMPPHSSIWIRKVTMDFVETLRELNLIETVMTGRLL